MKPRLAHEPSNLFERMNKESRISRFADVTIKFRNVLVIGSVNETDVFELIYR